MKGIQVTPLYTQAMRAGKSYLTEPDHVSEFRAKLKGLRAQKEDHPEEMMDDARSALRHLERRQAKVNSYLRRAKEYREKSKDEKKTDERREYFRGRAEHYTEKAATAAREASEQAEAILFGTRDPAAPPLQLKVAPKPRAYTPKERVTPEERREPYLKQHVEAVEEPSDRMEQAFKDAGIIKGSGNKEFSGITERIEGIRKVLEESDLLPERRKALITELSRLQELLHREAARAKGIDIGQIR